MLSERTRAADAKSALRDAGDRVSDRRRAELGLGTENHAADATFRDRKVWPTPGLFFKQRETEFQQ